MSLAVSNMTRDTMTQIHMLGYTVSVAMIVSQWTATAKNHETGRTHVVCADSQEQVMADLAAKVWTDHLRAKAKRRLSEGQRWDRGFFAA